MRFVWMLPVALVVLAPPAAYALSHRSDPLRAVKGAGLIAAAMYVGLFGLFVAGEALTDPGGWTGVGLVAAWLVPMVLLSLLAWLRPARARPVLVTLVAATVGVYAWSAVQPEVWRSFEDDTGPVRGIVAFALAAPLTVLAIRYLRDAGTMLVTLGVMPLIALVALRIADAGSVPSSLAVLDAPLLVIGSLFLIAAGIEGHSGAGRHPRQRPGVPTLVGKPPTTV